MAKTKRTTVDIDAAGLADVLKFISEASDPSIQFSHSHDDNQASFISALQRNMQCVRSMLGRLVNNAPREFIEQYGEKSK